MGGVTWFAVEVHIEDKNLGEKGEGEGGGW